MTALQKALDLVSKAIEEDQKGDYKAAFKLYQHGIEYFLHSVKYEIKSDKKKEDIRNQCALYLERADKLKGFLREQQTGKSVQESDSGPSSNEIKGNSASIDNEDIEMKKLLNQLEDISRRTMEDDVKTIKHEIESINTRLKVIFELLNDIKKSLNPNGADEGKAS